jgi:hypothetical protein
MWDYQVFIESYEGKCGACHGGTTSWGSCVCLVSPFFVQLGLPFIASHGMSVNYPFVPYKCRILNYIADTPLAVSPESLLWT